MTIELQLNMRIYGTLVVLTSAIVFANVAMAQGQKAEKESASEVKMTGSIKISGDSLLFVEDYTQKTWDVVNPAKLKGHEGQHVQVSGRVFPNKDRIQIVSVREEVNRRRPKDEMGPPTGGCPPPNPK